jgi:hypothetical protein
MPNNPLILLFLILPPAFYILSFYYGNSGLWSIVICFGYFLLDIIHRESPMLAIKMSDDVIKQVNTVDPAKHYT